MPKMYTDRGLVRESVALFRLLTQTIEVPKKRNRIVRMRNTQKGNAKKGDNE